MIGKAMLGNLARQLHTQELRALLPIARRLSREGLDLTIRGPAGHVVAMLERDLSVRGETP